MFWGPLAAGAARARRRPAHSFPVKKQQNISVIKLKDSATSVARSRRQRRSYDDLSTQRAHARSGDGTDALRNTQTRIGIWSFSVAVANGTTKRIPIQPRVVEQIAAAIWPAWVQEAMHSRGCGSWVRSSGFPQAVTPVLCLRGTCVAKHRQAHICGGRDSSRPTSSPTSFPYSTSTFVALSHNASS